MEVEVLFQAVREVEELTLYYGCNEEVLDRWTGYEGLRRLKRVSGASKLVDSSNNPPTDL